MGIINSELDVQFYLDSGASEHICNDVNLFRNYLKLKETKQIKIGDGTSIIAIGIGTIYLQSYIMVKNILKLNFKIYCKSLS